VKPDEIELLVQGALQKALPGAVETAITNALVSFGVEQDDRNELRGDFRHLRRWRKSVEQAQSMTFKAVVGTIATGLVAALWLGIKTYLGK
jgi:hypothetical protein